MSNKLIDYITQPVSTLFKSREFQLALRKGLCCIGDTGGTTYLQEGTNVTITGSGTEADPYIISSSGGSGISGLTAGYVPVADSSTSIINSALFQSGSNLLIGSVLDSGNGEKLQITGNSLFKGQAIFDAGGSTSTIIYADSGSQLNFSLNSFNRMTLSPNGDVKVLNLSGVGTRMVVADSTGILSTQAIPSGGSGWSLTGNSITSGDKLGTTNAQDLVIIARNDTWATFGNPNQSIVLGTNTNGNATSRNVVIGHFAGGLSMTGTDNTAVGRLALYASTGIGNSAFGQGAGYTGTFVSGNYNTFLGFETQTSNAAITNSTAVGANVVLSQSNTVILGNNADIGVGTATPAASAKMEIVSTTKGFLPPRMTTTQKNAISTPATGLEVFDSTLATTEFYDGTLWTGAWNRKGNIGASAANDFIGNRDNIDFNIRVNNTLVAKWSSVESVSVGAGSSASGQASIALGVSSLNSGIAAIALGYQSSVNGANNAIALGRLSQTNHEGAFTSQDYSGSNAFTSSVNYQWKTKFNGGYRFMIGTTVPVDLVKIGVDAGKALEVISTTAMFIPPVMTGAQAEAISSKTEGGMIYSTDGSGATITSKGWWGWNGTTWEKLNP